MIVINPKSFGRFSSFSLTWKFYSVPNFPKCQWDSKQGSEGIEIGNKIYPINTGINILEQGEAPPNGGRKNVGEK